MSKGNLVPVTVVERKSFGCHAVNWLNMKKSILWEREWRWMPNQKDGRAKTVLTEVDLSKTMHKWIRFEDIIVVVIEHLLVG